LWAPTFQLNNIRSGTKQRRKSSRLSPLFYSGAAFWRALYTVAVSEPTHLISPIEALRVVLERVEQLPVETLAHADVLNRTLARDVVASLDLPPFDNSAMDGYAVIVADLKNASETQPIVLKNLETIGAGEVATARVERGMCLKIMTGAPIPQGADAVVMREETRQRGNHVEFLSSTKAGHNIRRAGSDVARGETVLHAGTAIRAAQWAMLASLGESFVDVYRQPRVGILTTGRGIGRCRRRFKSRTNSRFQFVRTECAQRNNRCQSRSATRRRHLR
jgi:molybdopterin biosynthesis enzyme